MIGEKYLAKECVGSNRVLKRTIATSRCNDNRDELHPETANHSHTPTTRPLLIGNGRGKILETCFWNGSLSSAGSNPGNNGHAVSFDESEDSGRTGKDESLLATSSSSKNESGVAIERQGILRNSSRFQHLAVPPSTAVTPALSNGGFKNGVPAVEISLSQRLSPSNSITSSNSYGVIRGDNVTVKCEVDANPPVNRYILQEE